MEPEDWTVTDESVSVLLNGTMYSLKNGDPNFNAAIAAVRAKDWARIPALISRGLMVQEWAKGEFTFVDGVLLYRGRALSHRLHERVLDLAGKGENPSFLLRFWERLQLNPSYRSVNQLYDFLQHLNIAIDPEGFILAYKGVTREYLDRWTRTIDNSVGKPVEYPRNQISDDPRRACDEGLHAGAIDYARDYAGRDGRVIIVRIDPKDVVCIPDDCSFKKMRVCAYVVVGNMGGDLGPIHDEGREDDDDLDDDSDEFEGYDDDDDEDDDIAAGASSFASGLTAQSNPAKVKKAPVEKSEKTEPTKPAPVGNDNWSRFGALSDDEIRNQTVWDLRKYASRVLKIVGASKLRRDGPDGLVARILDVRKK